MRDISFFSKIYLAPDPVDFRKQAHGLALIVSGSLGFLDLNLKHLFVFTNKKKNAVKALYWDKTGYALWSKTLEKDRFRWPKSKEQTLNLEAKELRWLLDGIDLGKIKKHEPVILS